jgi:hypothetical protein
MSVAWGFKDDNFSNGAAYADLDNDGDLDLVVNHQNAVASVFKNLSREKNPSFNYIQLQLAGKGKNSRAIGTKVSIYTNGKAQYLEQVPSRGFQSAVSDRMHVGLNTVDKIDSIKLTWPSGGVKIIKDCKVNQLLKISEEETSEIHKQASDNNTPYFSKVDPLINFEHLEGGYNDFKRQPLLLTMLTPCGPVMAKGDVNNDGREDIFTGGAQGTPGKLFIQGEKGTFEVLQPGLFHKLYTDADALFFDADGDKDLDLYVVSGGYNEYAAKDKALQDRLYLNDGTGKFTLSPAGTLPEMFVSKSCVAAKDFDHDGDLDLFVGGRVIPGKYPATPESFLLRNNGGRFENITADKSNKLSRIGMVTDAKWIDVNADGWEDLIVAGEFMAIEVFINDAGKSLDQSTKKFFDHSLTGLWSKMIAHDFDKDGDEDIIVGNLGQNTQLRASAGEPITLVYKDFDKNGSIDPILNYYIKGKSYPFPSRDELLDQIYAMRSKYTSYASYADAQLNSIFSAADLKDAEVLKVNELESIYLENKQGKFVRHPLPQTVQFSPVYAMTLLDYNKDGNMDFVAAGNQSSIRIRMGVIDANFGQLYQGDGKGNFAYVPQGRSGLSITGDTKSLQTLKVNGDEYLLIGINNVGIATFKLNR